MSNAFNDDSPEDERVTWGRLRNLLRAQEIGPAT
jgi:hypothetical protein